MTARFDVLGLGCVAVDDLLYVAAYPPADAKVQVRRRERQGGGLTATALVAAARLGSACAYAATLGDDELSAWVIGRLAAEGIDVTCVRRLPGARPIHSTIIVDEARQTRTIFYDLEGVIGAQLDWPPEDVIRSARVLFVDHFGVEGMTRAVRVAHDAGIPVVADFERDDVPGFADLLAQVDHLIVSRAFAEKLTGEADPTAAAITLRTDGRQAVVITCGAEGATYLGADTPRYQPAFAVRAVDTTGCGDVFHGAYATALARGLDLAERVRFASASAALKATCRGGQAGSPTRAAVETFLKEHGA
jgi:sugar/nucleoside kinase (ribokinase family)